MKSLVVFISWFCLIGVSACGDDGNGDPGDKAIIQGTVADSGGQAVAGAEVSVGGKTAQTGADGSFEIADVEAGVVEVEATKDWYLPGSVSVTVADGETKQVDLNLGDPELKIVAADRTLAQSKGYDWTKDTVGVGVVTGTTHAALGMGVFLHNPILYDVDEDNQTDFDPALKPNIAGGTAQNFDFEVKTQTCANVGQQALDSGNVKDTLTDAGLAASDAFMFFPAKNYAIQNGARDDYQPLTCAAAAIDTQVWGSGYTVPAQRIERAWIANGDVWVEIVFSKWVMLGEGITDSDNDGRKEVFAKLDSAHITGGLITLLQGDFMTLAHDSVDGVRGLLDEMLAELYSTKNITVESTAGIPYDADGWGTFGYPFAVLAASGKKLVLLVESD